MNVEFIIGTSFQYADSKSKEIAIAFAYKLIMSGSKCIEMQNHVRNRPSGKMPRRF